MAAHADAVRIGGVAVGVVVLFVTGIDWLPVGIVGLLLVLVWCGWVAEGRSRPTEPVTG